MLKLTEVMYLDTISQRLLPSPSTSSQRWSTKNLRKRNEGQKSKAMCLRCNTQIWPGEGSIVNAVGWEGPDAMPLELLVFFVIRLLIPETEELICANMVVMGMVLVLVVGCAASPLPFWHCYLNANLHPCSPHQQL